MITLTLPAGSLSNGTVVRKPTGQKLYVQRSIKMYGEQRQEIEANAGLVFLIDEESKPFAITAIREDKLVSLDLSLDEALEFLQHFKDATRAEETRRWFQRIQDARESKDDEEEQRRHAGFQ